MVWVLPRKIQQGQRQFPNYHRNATEKAYTVMAIEFEIHCCTNLPQDSINLAGQNKIYYCDIISEYRILLPLL